MNHNDETIIVRDEGVIAEMAGRIAKSGRFAMDLEFMSADRYIPDLALVQLAWQEGDTLQLALIDGVGTKLDPIFELVASDSVLLIAHGAKQDLSLLATRYQVKAGAFVDTQIGAAFAGIAEQIGYGNLVEKLLGTRLDKGSQFTNWMRRPLSDKQLRYALDDVRYLGLIWDELKRRLDREERLAWAQEESSIMAVQAAEPRRPEVSYMRIGGAGGLKGSSLGALQALAAWREKEAVKHNLPPSWMIPDSAALDACRRKCKNEKSLRKIRGMTSTMVEKYGLSIVEEIQRGLEMSPPTGLSKKTPLDTIGQAQVAIVSAIVTGRSLELGMAQRAIGAKADAEALVRVVRSGTGESKLLEGWRYEVVGELAKSWIEGKAQVLSHPKYGISVEKIATE